MSDQVLTQTAPQAPVTPASPVQAEQKADDIVSRVSAFKAQPENGNQPAAKDANGISFNVKDLDKITDPVARKFAEDAYKSLQADYTRKTQALASERKEMEALKTKLQESGQFTPSKIQELLSNPSFVEAARQYEASQRQTQANPAQELTEEEFSYLSPEQQKLYVNQKRMHEQTQAMLASLNNELITAKTQKEDSELATKFKNYDANIVNQTYKDMMAGKIQATREHLWKALDYDEAVRRAYSLGQQDAKAGISQAHAASTQVNGVQTQTLGSDVPVKDKKESFNDYWKRLAEASKVKLGK